MSWNDNTNVTSSNRAGSSISFQYAGVWKSYSSERFHEWWIYFLRGKVSNMYARDNNMVKFYSTYINRLWMRKEKRYQFCAAMMWRNRRSSRLEISIYYLAMFYFFLNQLWFIISFFLSFRYCNLLQKWPFSKFISIMLQPLCRGWNINNSKIAKLETFFFFFFFFLRH